jgi:hypothetical protein
MVSCFHFEDDHKQKEFKSAQPTPAFALMRRDDFILIPDIPVYHLPTVPECVQKTVEHSHQTAWLLLILYVRLKKYTVFSLFATENCAAFFPRFFPHQQGNISSGHFRCNLIHHDHGNNQ